MPDSYRKLAFIPTRAGTNNDTVKSLDSYLTKAGWTVVFLVDKNSIFEAVQEARDQWSFTPHDRIILCHDDIELLYTHESFNSILDEELSKPDTGFVGLAGTPVLKDNAIWWQSNPYGQMKGYCFHGADLTSPTFFGPPGDVVVLDGVFLAATGSVFNTIQLKSPRDFEGGWDFYDIFYTFQAHLKGLKNRVLPMTFRHQSPGNVRPLWNVNREVFTQIFHKYLPATVVN